MRKRHYHILTILAAALSFVCCGQSEQEPVDEGWGTVVLNVGTIATRGRVIDSDPNSEETADSDDDSSQDDGDKMTSLSVWLVKGDAVYRFRNMDMSGSPAETAECDLGSCARGDYKLYVVANYIGLDSYKDDSTLDAGFKDKSFGTVQSGSSPAYSTAGALAKALNKTDALFTDENGGMPLSYVGDVAVGPGENKIAVELERICARFTVKITNNAVGKNVCINNLTLSDFNPPSGYLFPHTNDSGTNKVPFDEKVDVNFPDVTDDSYAIIRSGASMVLSDLYLFETDGTEDKSIIIRGALYDGNVTPSIAKGEIITYSVGDNTSSITSDKRYLIRSASSSTYYLGTEGTSVRLWPFPNDAEIVNSLDIEDFIWTISGSSNNGWTFFNKKHKVYLTISDQTGESGVGVGNSGVNLQYINNNIYCNYRSWNRWTYYLTNSSNKPSVVTSNQTQWNLREVTTKSDGDAWVFDKNKIKDIFFHSSITHVDKYGVPYLLAQLKRNEHLQMNISVSYSEATGNFDFKLENWYSKKSETTFD